MERKINFILIAILIISGFLRFYNLMHDAPYFFNPDERNMASAITQFRLPNKLSEIPNCLYSEFFSNNEQRLPAQAGITNNDSSCTLNPHFFAYGQFPLYLAYLSDQIQQAFSSFQRITNHELPARNASQSDAGGRTTSFSSAIYWLRFWSALASTMTVLLVYKISKVLLDQGRTLKVLDLRVRPYSLSILAALLTAFIPGLIQSAHFGTTESLLTFFFLCSLYFSLKMLSSLRRQGSMMGINTQRWIPAFAGMTTWLFLSSFSVGLAIGSKMTGVFFLVPPLLAITLILIRRTFILGKKLYKLQLNNWIIGIYWYLLVLITTAFIAVVSSPYNLVEPNNFLSAVFGYEADVARGKYEAFYTRQFVHTTPILFQFGKIFPYSLGNILTIFGTLGFIILILMIVVIPAKAGIHVLRKKSRNKTYLLRSGSRIALVPIKSGLRLSGMTLLAISFLIYLIPNAFLFAKWSRFMTPILPFFVIFAMYFLEKVIILKKMNKYFIVICYLLFVISLIQGLAFFSIYTRPDSRFTASRWIYNNISSGSFVLSETANVIDIPIPPPSTNNLQLTTYNLNPISFDFYHLDENPELQTQLISYLQKADYIFIPSRRIFANYTREPGKYPILNRYYTNLFNGNLGFEKVAEISSFPSLCIVHPPAGEAGCVLEINDESAEETFTVFDHPVVRIYKKIHPLSVSLYRTLLAS